MLSMLKKKKSIILIASILIIIILTISILLSNKKKNTFHIETIINSKQTYVESITTLVTKDKKLNKLLSEYVETQRKDFSTKIKDSNNNYPIGRDELNIDCKLNILNKTTWNIVLTVSMSGPSFKEPYHEIYCLTWNTKKQKQLNIKDVLPNQSSFDDIKNEVFEKLKKGCPTCLSEKTFTQIFTEDFKTFEIEKNIITIYFNPNILKNKQTNIAKVTLEINNPAYYKETKTKEIKKKKSASVKIIDPKKPVVALTFDDGPSKYTEEIINILKSYNVNATFFILGNKVDAYQDTLRKSIENQNELGNHSYNHKWLSKLSVGDLTYQMDKTQEIIKEKLNYTPKYLRPTYGSVTNRIRKNTNLEIVLWTVDTKDWKYHDTNKIIEQATTNIKDEDIILMHDIFDRTRDSLKTIIPKLLDQGFQFVTISELEEVKKIRSITNH